MHSLAAIVLAFAVPRAPPMVMKVIAPNSFEAALKSAPELCSALQDGKDAKGLENFLTTSAGARGFFVHYLTGDEWTVAGWSLFYSHRLPSLAVAHR